MSLGAKIKNFVVNKKFLVNIGLILLTYIVVVFIVKTFLNSTTNHGEKILVPDLTGKNVKDVQAILEDIGLEYEVVESIYDPTKPDGTVLLQNPEPTKVSSTFVKEGRILRIKISKKTQLVEVPNCVDKSQRFAENILKSRGFKYKVEYKASTESAGAVMQQLYNGRSIEEKEKIAIGSTITLIVGRGGQGEEFPTPNLVDLTICDVKSRLSLVPNVNLVVICNGCVTSADSCAAIVNSQSPEYIEGSVMSAGATLTVHATKQ